MRHLQSITERRPICVIVASILGALLAACSQTVNEFTVFADPGQYEYFSCDQLLPQRKYWAAKEQELKLLMDKARQGTGGTVVSVIAYQSDYVTAREELKLIDAAARVKKCKIPDEPQSNSTIK
jgi:hypothetical protein